MWLQAAEPSGFTKKTYCFWDIMMQIYLMSLCNNIGDLHNFFILDIQIYTIQRKLCFDERKFCIIIVILMEIKKPEERKDLRLAAKGLNNLFKQDSVCVLSIDLLLNRF